MNDVQTAKVLSMVFLGLFSMIFGAIPLKLGPKFTNDTKGWKQVVISILSCFGGGVLFATALIHMLPEVIENIDAAGDAGLPKVKEYPTAFILFCCGFFLIYLIEELVHSIADKSVHHGGNKVHNIHPSQTDDIEKSDSKNKMEYEDLSNIDDKENSNSSIRDFLVVLALTFHAVLEGVAIGLEAHVNDVWLIFAAVASHKYVISFCFGLELYIAKTRLGIYVAYIFIFSIMSPVGIGIGLAVIETITPQSVTYYMSVGVLQALASGTILYVVVFEILQRERSKNINGLLQFLSIIVGFSIMMTVEFLAGHDHGHVDHDEHDLLDDHEDHDHHE